jgi:hypothetical protein
MNQARRMSLVLILILFTSIYAKASDTKIDRLHLLLISNGHYIYDRTASTGGISSMNKQMLDFSGAFVSSMVVNSLFQKNIGITSSTLLRSDENRFITKGDIFNILDKVKEKISTPEKGEYLVIYYVGHGFSEGIAWNYFLQPGNIEIPKQLNSFDIEALAEQLVYVGYFNDNLNDIGIPYLFLIDACYEGNAVDFNVPTLSSVAEKNLQDSVAILKFMNQFRGTNPVVFSTTPGDTVNTVKHPFNPKLRYNIGPIARRLVLAFQGLEHSNSVSIKDIVTVLKSSDLDSVTKPVVSYADYSIGYHFNDRSPHSNTNINVKQFYGSATIDDYKPLFQSSESTKIILEETSAPENYTIKSATISIIGKLGEYISEGRDHTFTSGIEQIEIITLSESEIVLEMQTNDDIWNFCITAPVGESLQQTDYKNVARCSFQEGKQAGLEVSGAGRGCNNISGSFNIDSIDYIGDLPVFISLSFQQFCDDENLSINGMMILELKEE